MWDPQFDLFARRFRVVRYDHRGFGKTKPTHTPFMLHEDLLSVMRRLGIARAVLIGCSMGGTTAIDFALAYPDMVDALVLSGPGLSGWAWSPEMVKFLTEMFERVGAGDIDGARELNERLWLDGPRDSRSIDPIYRARASALSFDNFRPRMNCSALAARVHRCGAPGEIKAPTLVMIGDCDAPDLHKIATLLVSEIAGARIWSHSEALYAAHSRALVLKAQSYSCAVTPQGVTTLGTQYSILSNQVREGPSSGFPFMMKSEADRSSKR